MWDALVEIADREASTVNQICTWVDGHRAENRIHLEPSGLYSQLLSFRRGAGQRHRFSAATEARNRPYRTNERMRGKVANEASVDMTMAAAMSLGSRS